MPQTPLTERELTIVRAMIDEYERTYGRRRFFRETFGEFRGVVVFAGALLLVVLQIIAIYAALRGHK